MSTENRIRVAVAKVNLQKHQNDFSYWQSQPYQARLAALEQIRSEYNCWRYGVEQRLQRVYSIVKR